MTKVTINTDNADIAKDQFIDQQNKRYVMDNRQDGSISASRLYKYVMGHGDEGVREALGADLSLSRAYKTLLQQSAYFHIPQAIAASSDEFPERHCNGCIIRLQASRAESDQVYLIIEVADQRSPMPNALSVFDGAGGVQILHLPEARNGVIQTIIDKNSDLARLLADPKSETFLR